MLVIERSIPECIKKSPMMQKGGFEIVNGLLPEPKREQMLAEAIRLYPESCQSYEPESDGEEIRGGSPARQFLSSQGGQFRTCFTRITGSPAYSAIVPVTISLPRVSEEHSPTMSGRGITSPSIATSSPAMSPWSPACWKIQGRTKPAGA
jgi:hypothetical protein